MATPVGIRVKEQKVESLLCFIESQLLPLLKVFKYALFIFLKSFHAVVRKCYVKELTFYNAAGTILTERKDCLDSGNFSK
jgi:hypothetical protein